MINPELVKRAEEFVFLHVAIIDCTYAALMAACSGFYQKPARQPGLWRDL